MGHPLPIITVRIERVAIVRKILSSYIRKEISLNFFTILIRFKLYCTIFLCISLIERCLNRVLLTTCVFVKFNLFLSKESSSTRIEIFINNSRNTMRRESLPNDKSYGVYSDLHLSSSAKVD